MPAAVSPSDRVPVLGMEQRTDDVRAVLDDVGAEHVALVGAGLVNAAPEPQPR